MYVSEAAIREALQRLPTFHPFLGVTLLSMKRSDLPVGGLQEWTDETALLDEYYAPPGAPRGKKYFIPFGDQTETGYWRKADYSGSSLQTYRTQDRGSTHFKRGLRQNRRGGKEWGFTPDHLQVFAGHLERGEKIRVADMAAWLYRDADVGKTFDDVVQKFTADFHLDQPTVGALFDPAPPALGAAYLAAAPISEQALLRLTGGVAPGAALNGRGEGDVLRQVVQHVAQTSRLALPDGFVAQFYYALKAQRFVVLAGQPGTGKTAFARAYAEGLAAAFQGAAELVVIQVGQDFGESDAIGYLNLSNSLAPTEFTTRVLRTPADRGKVFVVVLDEMNLSHVDFYFSRVLPAVESGARIALPGVPEPVALPPDTYFVGTINSFLAESNRLPLSGPAKRRANVIEMPNQLGLVVKRDDRAGFEALMRTLLDQTLDGARRVLGAEDGPSVFDAFRVAGLERAVAAGSAVFEPAFVDLLWGMAKACAASPLTSLTAGVLQDVLDFVAMSDALAPRQALALQVAHKIVPQLSGPEAVAKGLHTLLAGQDDADPVFRPALDALEALLATADVTGTVTYPY